MRQASASCRLISQCGFMVIGLAIRIGCCLAGAVRQRRRTGADQMQIMRAVPPQPGERGWLVTRFYRFRRPVRYARRRTPAVPVSLDGSISNRHAVEAVSFV